MFHPRAPQLAVNRAGVVHDVLMASLSDFDPEVAPVLRWQTGTGSQ